ncbi:DUF4838 domain-containing protein [Sphingobacterium puteale]|uniref:DUF4838 domain-containing protein n=1 Tax=Sphingobacterium puteale TaxID=2420510 RepID=UPI003D97B674
MQRILTLCIFILLSVSDSFSNPIFLWKKNNSPYSIVLAKNATDSELKAAEIFQKYFKKKSDLSIPIIYEGSEKGKANLYIGLTNFAKSQIQFNKLQNEGYFIGLNGENIIIAGKTVRGTVNGIFGFLRKYLGVEMLSRDFVYCIPEVSKNIDLVRSNYINPSFQSVDIFNAQSYSDDYTFWGGINHLFKNGFDSDWGIFGHSFFKIIPPEKYFKSHPDFFLLKNGKPSQLNLDNEFLVKEVISNLKILMKAKPSKKLWMVGQEDDGSFNDLKIANGTNTTDNLILFINKIAKAFPEKIIGTLSFQQTQKAPLKVKPLSNVLVCFAPIDAIYNIPIFSGYNTRFSKELLKWKTLTNNLMVWEYVANYTDSMLPYPSFTVIGQNLRYYHKNGVSRLYLEGLNLTEEVFSELYTYLFLRQYWDITINVNATIKEFCEKYYGKSSVYVMQYIEKLNTNVNNSNGILRFYDTKKDYLNSNFLNDYDRTLENAALSVKDSPLFLARVNKLRSQVDFQLLKGNIKQGDSRSNRFLQTMREQGVSSVKSNSKNIKINY